MTSMNCKPLRAMDERKVADDASRNIRIPNISMRNIGSGTWSSIQMKSASKSGPRTSDAMTNGLPQPISSPPYG